MTVSLDIPWKRYGLITELARRVDGVSPQFGKTALQKLVYLLQAVFGVDCGYDFQLYSYGPFDSQLSQDLDLVEHLGGVVIHTVLSVTGGYVIRPGEKSDILREKAIDFLTDEKVSGALDKLVKEFGWLGAKELELRATIVYVAREIEAYESGVTHEELAEIVKNIKHRFSDAEIGEVIAEMCDKGFIKVKG